MEEYIQSLVRVFREVWRVLRHDGTLWVNIGDSYATRSGPQPPTNTRNSYGHTAKHTPSGYKHKDLIGVPWRLAFALLAGPSWTHSQGAEPPARWPSAWGEILWERKSKQNTKKWPLTA